MIVIIGYGYLVTPKPIHQPLNMYCSHAELMLRKKAEIAMQKYTLYVERTKLQRENGIARCSGDEESYDKSLAERRDYRRAVKSHIKNGGWCFKVRGKNVADLRHGWCAEAHIIANLDPVEEDEFKTETVSFWGSTSRPIVWADEED